MIQNKKAITLLVLKILENYSDENHFLTQQQIIDLIEQNYGVTYERKAIANSITLLQDLDFDVNKSSNKGFALLSRNFDKSEVTFLNDAIFSSKMITGVQAQQLSNKISGCLSKYDRKSYDYLYKSSEINRTSNKEIFYNIELINEAITKKKCINFKYLIYDENNNFLPRYEGHVYTSSPCFLVNNYGRYYLVGFSTKYNHIVNFRVDLMTEIHIDDNEMMDLKDIDDLKQFKNVPDYLNSHIYLFSTEVCEATLLLKDNASIQSVKDWFGESAKIYKENNNLYTRVKCDEQALFYWVMQYNKSVMVIEPQSLIDKIKAEAQNIIQKYK